MHVPFAAIDKPKFELQSLKHCPSFKEYPFSQTLHSRNILWKPSIPQVTQLFGQLTQRPEYGNVDGGQSKF